MSNLSEHMAEQSAITARYDALTAIGTLAHELGAEIETCEDTDAALVFCAERQDNMSPSQLLTLDEARADNAEDRHSAALMQPFTVLLMLPDWKRGDQSHESDHICRVWTEATDPETAVDAAKQKLPEDLGWTDYDLGDLEDYSPVAVYPGHIFDLFKA